MRAPAFWWRPHSLPATLLAPLGWIYGAVTARRMARAGQKASLPVVCIGNFVAGGAGKTPTAIAVARDLAALGRRPVFLSRGYGGSLAGPVVVDPAVHAADECGDEPLLLARVAPVVVATDRAAGAALAARHGDVIVMDDGLQNPTLQKDLRLAVVDGESGVGNGACVPAGPLRAPLARQLPHVDAVIVIGAGSAGDRVAAQAAQAGVDVLRARLEADATVAGRLAGRSVLAFAGIGRPEKFWASLDRAGARVTATRAFPDHHAYASAEIAGLLGEASAKGLLAVTTEKDWVRLAGVATPDQMSRIAVLPVTLAFADETGRNRLLARFSGAARP
ncbi:tetraacyldisaccharide 4'-kinase [uncultured Alsobacter sp.]|uniref:tetraacyldisaccharide 4'-kinase n=1 Tax=uncultured Alsobacter sp. TaxID=1748258 RepID=UPI0025DFEA27|nr:tetraacyldisaccharide 4'-kinase [uncultured Alsobacter sp.]